MPYLVGLTGPTCSGKTSVCSAIARDRGYECVVQDSFFVDKESYPTYNGFVNMDSPDAINNELLFGALQSLKRGERAIIPVYDSVASRAIATRTAYPTEVVLVEGFMLFHDQRVRDTIDFKIYLDIDQTEQRRRRIERGIHADVRYFDEVVIKMFLAYGIGMRDFADAVIDARKPIETLSEEVVGLMKKRGILPC